MTERLDSGPECADRVTASNPDTPAPFSPAALTARLDGFEALQVVAPSWDQVHLQVGRGSPSVRVAFAQTRELQVGFVARAPGARIRGAPPRGSTALVVVLAGERLHLQGIPWRRGTVGVAHDGQEFDVLAPGPHAELVLAARRERLERIALERWGRPLPTRVGPWLHPRDGTSLRATVRACARFIRAGRANPRVLADPARAARMEDELVGAFLDAISPDPVAPPLRPRADLARRAESFLYRSMDQPVRVADVCAAVGASPRAVHAAFHDVFGLSPKAYRKSLRLSAVRAELQRSGAHVTVSEVAVRWGFFQLGYFAVDYRRMFGERPSETLRGALAARASVPRPAGPRPAA